MKKILHAVAAFSALFAAPLLAAAATAPTPNIDVLRPYQSAIVGGINTILVPVLISIAFITFLWGVYNYFILGADDEKKRIEGRQFVLWGIIGFVIILSLWGIVTILRNTLGFGTSSGSATSSGLLPPTL